MATGTVKWFNDDKGFGFITPDDPGADLFVHHSGINSDGFRTLREGARVTYESEAGPKGPKAVNVTRHLARGPCTRAVRRRRGRGRASSSIVTAKDPLVLPCGRRRAAGQARGDAVVDRVAAGARGDELPGQHLGLARAERARRPRVDVGDVAARRAVVEDPDRAAGVGRARGRRALAEGDRGVALAGAWSRPSRRRCAASRRRRCARAPSAARARRCAGASGRTPRRSRP